MAAAPHLGRSPTCLNCLRQLARPAPLSPSAITSSSSPVTVSLVQIRSRTTKAELEDLQGIPVRLLKNITGFGRKHAIIRVKPGRMRNFWFPKNQAEYMTKNRFQELGLTEAAIGVRDRTFGTQLVPEEDKSKSKENLKRAPARQEPISPPKKETQKETIAALSVTPEETQALLTTILPPVLTFVRKPIATPTPAPEEPAEPVVPRSPSLALNAASSQGTAPKPKPEKKPEKSGPVAIFGSVSTGDVLQFVKEAMTVDSQASRIVLEDSNISILGIDAGEDRIKRLGTFKVEISPGPGLEPIRRTLKVVPDQ